MPLLVHRSNRVERLAESLARVVEKPLADPFARECIVVQGPGMERWLSALLSRELGVWANPWFPFPRALIELLLERALGPVAEDAPSFGPEALVFRVAKRLPEHLAEPAFREVATYLRDDRAGERLLELAQRLAERFDQYVIYRPELVLAWEREARPAAAGDPETFQRELFRSLVKEPGAVHLAQRMLAFERALADGFTLEPGQAGVPERVALFGLSTLPPAFLRLLARVAEQLEIHLFLLTPSREYWGDLDRRERAHSDLRGFLAELGKVSREFVELLETVPYLEPDPDLFDAAGHASMLSALQSDLVGLTARARARPGLAALEQPLPIAEQDDSLRVHVCHGMVRELEVLRDQLRARFERDPTLEARDVVVFTPDIERYAPAIEAVFAEPRQASNIPFRIADRRALSSSQIAEAFSALLELLSSRLHLSDVLDLLHRGAVRARFGIAELELDRIQAWLASAGGRWAVDAAHRSSFGQPAFGENSLRFALERLLVGYAAPDGEQRELFDVLPLPEVEGQGALLLGKLARYLERLFAWVRALATPRPPAELAALLIELLAAMLSDEGELAAEHHALRAALAELGRDAERAGFAAPVGLASVRRLLERRIERGRVDVGFLAGGVTFCEPVPMRAIPFRVVALLGMDDESFPRRTARPSFDLMADSPELGDRNLRDDDRQLFLEALLSARDALHVSYVGKSAQDDRARPASVLVDQLLRLCDQHFVFADAGRTLSLGLEGSVARATRHEHALHRFDPRYFQRGDSVALFSYDETAAASARALRAPKRAARPFSGAPLPPPEPRPLLALDALTRFFRYPQEIFLKERLQLYLPRELDDVADREPLELDALERFRIADELLRQRDLLAEPERARLLAKAGRLAPGTLGRVQLAELESQVDAVLAAYPVGSALPDRAFALELANGRLFGRFSCLEREARVVRSVGKLHARRRLSVFIEHLALCAAGGEPTTTILIGREQKRDTELVTFAPVEDSTRLLEELLGLYRIGVCMPLPLFHDAGEGFVRDRAKGTPEIEALARAQLKLTPARGQPGGVADDPHVLQVFSREQLGDLASLWASDGSERVGFADVSMRVFAPLLACVDARAGARERNDAVDARAGARERNDAVDARERNDAAERG